MKRAPSKKLGEWGVCAGTHTGAQFQVISEMSITKHRIQKNYTDML